MATHSLSLTEASNLIFASPFSEHLTVASWIQSCSHIWRCIFSSPLFYLAWLCLSFSFIEILSDFHGCIFFTLPMKLLLKYSVRERGGNLVGKGRNHLNIYYVTSTGLGTLHTLFQKGLPISWIPMLFFYLQRHNYYHYYDQLHGHYLYVTFIMGKACHLVLTIQRWRRYGSWPWKKGRKIY